MMKRIIEKTDDGSATLFVPELNEHYHSTKGARTESQHIFIDMGLKASSATTPRILEIGFGTGLNAWLTLEEAERSGRNIHYTGLELYPLEWQTIEQLGYISNDEQLTTTDRQQPAIELFKQLHTSPWEKDVQLTPHFTLRKVETDVNKWVENREQTISNVNDSVTNAESPALNPSFNLIYFDAFAPEKQEFYIYNQDSIITYNIYKRTSEQLPYMPEKTTFPIRLGMNFYDESKGNIYAYELNWAETFIAKMNPQTRTWDMINQNDITLQMHHHSAIFNPQKQQFLFFGGYGNRRYYNTFITYDLLQERWDTLHFAGDKISPRFFAGIAMSPDCKHAYIYGGKGNETGDQNVGIQYYYDFYQLDFETKQIKKLWEHKAPSANRIPTRDMILSEDGKYVYLLAYPEYKPETHLQLYRLSISDGSYEALGDSIPLTSE